VVLRALHLCSGYGGFELGLRLAGIPARTVAHVERDTYAAATLVARMDDQALDQAPVWSDLTTFDGAPWRGRVDLITAGFPCQPFSQAGQRRGVDDDRWLWPHIAGIVADVGPRYVFLENVPGLVHAGLPHVLADLTDLGFDAEWGLLSASAVGAPHRRERFWLLAYADGGRCEVVGQQPRSTRGWLGRDADGSGGADVGHPKGERREGRRADGNRAGGTESGGDGDADVGDTDGDRRRGVRVPLGRQGSGAKVGGTGEDVADAPRSRRDERRRQTVEPPAVGRRGATDRSQDVADADVGGLVESIGDDDPRRRQPDTARRFPPPPDDTDGWERWTAEGGPQPSIRRSVDGRPVGLADALHLGGNGLVPRVAAAALRQLAERAGVTL
jgi:DNA (cytosine-5)-methyltransferase 1